MVVGGDYFLGEGCNTRGKYENGIRDFGDWGEVRLVMELRLECSGL